MLKWFIELAYFFEKIPDILYMFLFIAIIFFLWIESREFDKKQELKEKAENYEKLKDFIHFLINNKNELYKQVRIYRNRNKYNEDKKIEEKEIDDFMNILVGVSDERI